MAVEISAPVEVTEDQPTDEKQKVERIPFTDEYVADEKGRISVTFSFPRSAISPGFRPVEQLMALAEHNGLKGYGEGDTPIAYVATARAKQKDGTPNPQAGQPTGHITMVLHTDETLTEARKRGRQSMDPQLKSTLTEVTRVVKAAIEAGSMGKVQEALRRMENGEITQQEFLMELAAAS